MSETMNTEYQKREVLNTWTFMGFATEFGTQLNTAEVKTKDGDSFKCAAFSKRKADGELETTLVDFTSNVKPMTVAEMVKERDSLRVIALDYSDEEHEKLVRYKLCRSNMTLQDDAVDLSSL